MQRLEPINKLNMLLRGYPPVDQAVMRVGNEKRTGTNIGKAKSLRPLVNENST